VEEEEEEERMSCCFRREEGEKKKGKKTHQGWHSVAAFELEYPARHFRHWFEGGSAP